MTYFIYASVTLLKIIEGSSINAKGFSDSLDNLVLDAIYARHNGYSKIYCCTQYGGNFNVEMEIDDNENINLTPVRSYDTDWIYVHINTVEDGYLKENSYEDLYMKKEEKRERMYIEEW